MKIHAFLLIAVFLLSACGPAAAPLPTATVTVEPSKTPLPAPSVTPTGTAWPADAPSLRQLAEKRGLLIGTAAQPGLIASQPLYRETLAREFNAVTPENEMKMCAVWPERSRWDFSGADALVQFAQEHQMKVRGHTLVWIDCTPDWVKNGSFTKEEAKAVLKEYITTLVGRYQGKIYAWDVLNETVYRGSVWDKLIGPEYEKLAFEWAHEADPGALLFYNDFNIEAEGAKFERVYQFVKSLKEAGAPIDGVGMQMHFTVTPAVEEVTANMKKLAELGLQVHITELDLPLDHTSRTALEDQALGYGDMMRACLQAGNCTAFITWGFTDNYTWLNQKLNDPDADPLLFDKSYRPKPAYAALYEALLK